MDIKKVNKQFWNDALFERLKQKLNGTDAEMRHHALMAIVRMVESGNITSNEVDNKFNPIRGGSRQLRKSRKTKRRSRKSRRTRKSYRTSRRTRKRKSRKR